MPIDTCKTILQVEGKNGVKVLGYKETLKFAKRLEKKINNEVKKYGIKSNDLIQSIEFILKRKF